MKKLALWVSAAAPLLAQSTVGTWQGTLTNPQGKSLRIVLKISRADNESLKAVFYSIDRQSPAIKANSATLQGSSLKVTIPAIGGGYEGKLEGDTITGTWNQGAPAPLNLARATPATEWAIPDPPPPPKLMAKDANPTFEVSTIKPNKPDAPGKSILVGRGGANLFTTTNTTVYELIAFAYGMHRRQVTDARVGSTPISGIFRRSPIAWGAERDPTEQDGAEVLEDESQLTFRQKREEKAFGLRDHGGEDGVEAGEVGSAGELAWIRRALREISARATRRWRSSRDSCKREFWTGRSWIRRGCRVGSTCR